MNGKWLSAYQPISTSASDQTLLSYSELKAES